MDPQTLSYYKSNAREVCSTYAEAVGGVSDYFTSSFLPGSKVLDVGCAAGRDVARLLELGFDGYGLEPCQELIDAGLQRYPELKGRLEAGGLPHQATRYETYDGVVCSAVLMHLPSSDLFDALIALRKLLKVDGRLLVSIPLERDDIHGNRDQHNRLFEPLKPEQLTLLCKRLGLDLINDWDNDDSAGREGIRWVTLLFVKRASVGKPLDRIESVLRNDRKTTTYKLALLRAFCDIAELDDQAVEWLPSGMVALPIQSVAECWLHYYWPLVAAPDLIPQNNSEGKNGGNPIAFKKELSELIALAEDYYGFGEGRLSKQLLTAFNLDWKKQRLPRELSSQLSKTLTKIANTIIKGPVKYSDQGDMFSYDKSRRAILVESDLWLEFCLTGYWVRDSLLLRWAQLTCDFAKRQTYVTTGLVMELLLLKPDVDREQNIARQIYQTRSDLRCVWSDKPLEAKWDVDHALPFALWLNNDLWNLQPANSSVNNQKRDNVPATDFLLERKDALTDNWEFLHTQEPAMFRFEVERTLGRFPAKDWHQHLFEHMKRKAEQGIYTRGAQEWRL